MPLNYVGLIKHVREFQADCLKTSNTHLRAWANEDGKAFLTDKFYNPQMKDEQARQSAGVVQASLKELLKDMG
jgi:hypothetical protein